MRALVLTRGHEVLLRESDKGAEVLRLLDYADAALADLDSAGVTPDDGQTFVVAAPLDGTVALPLREALRRVEDPALWRLYVAHMLGGWTPPTRDLDVFFFGDEPQLAALLAHLVVCGRKRATACHIGVAELQGWTLPTPGLVSIVTDAFGMPRAAIRTVRTHRLRLCDVPEALAALEGEGDLSLSFWRAAHVDYFGREAARLGLTFSEEDEVLIEEFEVIQVLGAP